MQDFHKTTGVILAGGKSTRMGQNKAFLEIDGIPIIQRTYSVFDKLFSEILIVSDEIEPYRRFGVKIYADLFPMAGVAGGLYTGLFFSSHPYSFCVASDMPFLKESVIEYLLKDMDNYDVIVPQTRDGLQPLHAMYSKNCLDPLKVMLEQKGRRITDFYSRVRTRIVNESEFLSLDPERESFININTPEDLLRIRMAKDSVNSTRSRNLEAKT